MGDAWKAWRCVIGGGEPTPCRSSVDAPPLLLLRWQLFMPPPWLKWMYSMTQLKVREVGVFGFRLAVASFSVCSAASLTSSVEVGHFQPVGLVVDSSPFLSVSVCSAAALLFIENVSVLLQMFVDSLMEHVTNVPLALWHRKPLHCEGWYLDQCGSLVSHLFFFLRVEAPGVTINHSASNVHYYLEAQGVKLSSIQCEASCFGWWSVGGRFGLVGGWWFLNVYLISHHSSFCWDCVQKAQRQEGFSVIINIPMANHIKILIDSFTVYANIFYRTGYKL